MAGTKTAKTATYSPEQVDRQHRTTTRDALITMLKQVVVADDVERDFSTGSLGHYLIGKAVAQDGVRYQVAVTLTRIGTKPEK